MRFDPTKILLDPYGRDVAVPDGYSRAAAHELVAAGAAELLAVTVGAEGVLLAPCERILRVASPPGTPRSAVGAGDSFAGAITLAQGRAPEDAFLLGVAAGTATVLTPGTELCRRADVERLYVELRRAP